MSTTQDTELEAARAELTDLRIRIREAGEATSEDQARVDELLDTIERLEGEKIEAWARTPGVALVELPAQYRAAVERRRDELAEEELATPEAQAKAAELLERAGEGDPDTVPVSELEAAELRDAVTHGDEHEHDAALAELRRRAAQRDFMEGDEVGPRQSREARAAIDELNRPADGEAAAADVLERTGKALANVPDEFREEPAGATVVRLARVLEEARGVLNTYGRRRRRLADLDVRDTRDAREAKLKLELGEAQDTLDALVELLDA